MLTRIMFGLCLMCSLAVIAEAQCPTTCDWDYDHCTGCSDGIGKARCTCLGSVCYFDSCTSARNDKCADLKLASTASLDKRSTAVRLEYFPILGAPARLEEVASRGPADLVHSALLYNVSHEAIQTIRIGWVTVSPDPMKQPVSGLSQPIRLSESSQPDHPIRLTSMSITVPKVAPGSAVSFFIAEVTFASGQRWKADIERLKWTAMPTASHSPVRSTSIIPRDALPLQ
jgi:hypothetical protein